MFFLATMLEAAMLLSMKNEPHVRRKTLLEAFYKGICWEEADTLKLFHSPSILFGTRYQ
jgi:hypothetical protein